MITCVARPSVSLIIGLAAFLIVFGLVVWLFSRRKGDRATGPVMLVGLPGIYLSGLAALGAPKWLYIPALVLVVSSYLMQLVFWRRQRANDDAAPPDADCPV
jgi:hypothetical protein